MTKIVHSKSELRRLQASGVDVVLATPQPGDDDNGARPKLPTNLEPVAPDEWNLGKACVLGDTECESCQ